MGQERLASKELLFRARSLRREQSTPETVMWAILRDRRLLGLKFRRQHPLGPFIADFYCAELKWVIEVDGGQHNTEHARAYDAKRSAYLSARGLVVTRFWTSEVMDESDGVVERLVEIAGARATQIGSVTLTPALSQRERAEEVAGPSETERREED